jgi:hypothetical protein
MGGMGGGRAGGGGGTNDPDDFSGPSPPSRTPRTLEPGPILDARGLAETRNEEVTEKLATLHSVRDARILRPWEVARAGANWANPFQRWRPSFPPTSPSDSREVVVTERANPLLFDHCYRRLRAAGEPAKAQLDEGLSRMEFSVPREDVLRFFAALDGAERGIGEDWSNLRDALVDIAVGSAVHQIAMNRWPWEVRPALVGVVADYQGDLVCGVHGAEFNFRVPMQAQDRCFIPDIGYAGLWHMRPFAFLDFNFVLSDVDPFNHACLSRSSHLLQAADRVTVERGPADEVKLPDGSVGLTVFSLEAPAEPARMERLFSGLSRSVHPGGMVASLFIPGRSDLVGFTLDDLLTLLENNGFKTPTLRELKVQLQPSAPVEGGTSTAVLVRANRA